MARDVILNLAVSLDGFICDEDGGCSRRGFRQQSSIWTAAPWRTASPSWSTAGGAGEKNRQQPQGAFPAAVVLRFEKI